ncbi:DUF4399 domain-containing protein [Tahibacter amnicola]|uniref:DUF4399 domain-containing protein n=1 Tax=Tahibacter amnicola TaxID=2976241 RepID=A0ABY6BII6_9GAMM|nr:DUF4399 domain-containing protein [Tahibacter amnicola]UXI69579.1 DUF4399 domain-containing protein [Tahibacter amnicola]
MLRAMILAAGLATGGLALAEDATAPGLPPRTKAPANVELYIISPKDGEVVGKEFTVRFGLKGMGVAPAGVAKENTGHHHLLIDVATSPPMNLPLPNDDHHRHFGGGQTETTVTLPPGKHTLQLMLGDALHIPFDPPIQSPKITVEVK